jgi:predicted transcriptional regulator
MSNRQEALLSFLREHGPKTTKDLGKTFDIEDMKVHRALKPLLKYNLAQKENSLWEAI